MPTRTTEVPIASRIRVPNTSEIVADQIRAQIERDERNEGDFLTPSAS